MKDLDKEDNCILRPDYSNDDNDDENFQISRLFMRQNFVPHVLFGMYNDYKMQYYIPNEINQIINDNNSTRRAQILVKTLPLRIRIRIRSEWLPKSNGTLLSKDTSLLKFSWRSN